MCMNRHRPLAEPLQPGLAIGRVEDVLEGVAAMPRPHPGGDGEQMPVVVAEDAVRGVAEAAQPAQHAERIAGRD